MMAMKIVRKSIQSPAVQSRQDTKDQSKDQTNCHGLQTQLQRSRETLGNDLVCGKAGSLIGLSHLAVKKILQINNILLSYRFIEAPTCLQVVGYGLRKHFHAVLGGVARNTVHHERR